MDGVDFSDVLDEINASKTFDDFSIRSELIGALREQGRLRPSPVQVAALEAGLGNDDSLLVQAKSGTGKTVAFGILLFQAMDTTSKALEGVVFCPTRELALQVGDELQRLSWRMQPRPRVCCCVGGVPIIPEVSRLKTTPPPVMVCTPGRFLSLLQHGFQIHTDGGELTGSTGEAAASAQKWPVKVVVADEVDRLLDDQFAPQTRRALCAALRHSSRFLGFSATLSPPLLAKIETTLSQICPPGKKAKKDLGRPRGEILALNSEGVPVDSDDEHEDQSGRRRCRRVFLCSSLILHPPPGGEGEGHGRAQGIKLDGSKLRIDKPALRGITFAALIVPSQADKAPAVLRLLQSLPFRQVVVFCNRTAEGIRLSELLEAGGLPSVYTSARLEHRHRVKSLALLKAGKKRALVCSDVIARGIDLESADVVINFDLPLEVPDFLHRSGRAGRYGGQGLCVTISAACEEDELRFFAFQLREEFIIERGDPEDLAKVLRRGVEDNMPDAAVSQDSTSQRPDAAVSQSSMSQRPVSPRHPSKLAAKLERLRDSHFAAIGGHIK